MRECDKRTIETNDYVNVLKHNKEDRIITRATTLISYCAKNCKNYDCVEECAESLVQALFANKQK